MAQTRQDASAATPKVDAHAVGEAARDLAAADLGGRPACADDTAPIWAGWGPDAYRVRLATDDPRWTGTLVARTSAPDALARERAWVIAARDAGYPAPEPVTDGDAPTLLVFRQPAGTNLAEHMISRHGGPPPPARRLRPSARPAPRPAADAGAAPDAPRRPALDGDAAARGGPPAGVARRPPPGARATRW